MANDGMPTEEDVDNVIVFTEFTDRNLILRALQVGFALELVVGE